MRRQRMIVWIWVAVAVVVVCGLLAGPSGARAAENAVFVGLTPCRLVDTRGNGFTGPFGPRAWRPAFPGTSPSSASAACRPRPRRCR